MNSDFIYASAFLGAVTFMAIVCSLAVMAISFLRDLIENRIHKYRYEHRFDKPPVAKCYCRDCRRWNIKNGKCSDQCNLRQRKNVKYWLNI